MLFINYDIYLSYRICFLKIGNDKNRFKGSSIINCISISKKSTITRIDSKALK